MIEDRRQAARESSERVIDGENGVIGSKGAGSSLDGIPEEFAPGTSHRARAVIR